MCSVRRAVTNNTLKNMPQTSTVFYLALRGYSSAQSICNWHRLNEKLQPSKDLFSISCRKYGICHWLRRQQIMPHKTLQTRSATILGASCQFSGGIEDAALPSPSREAAVWFRTGDTPLPDPLAHVPAKFSHRARDTAS